jgi:light-regulated signal transduction histidine kinase (bacteriophytochrome)
VTTELERCTRQLNEVTRELESLSYTVSHDLRAPLRHIEAFTALLEQNLAGKLDANSTEYLGIIVQSIRQMTQLLEGVLSYSRLCQRELNLTCVSLDQAVKAVFQDFKLETEGRQIEWQIEPLPEVQADPWMIRQALVLVISNALKFTRYCAPARIRIDAVGTADEVTLRIRDNGIGFDMQYTNRLFGLFQRLHSDERFEGAGVGLAHVRRMVLRQGGRIWAEAKPGDGATFLIALPTPARV